MSWTDGRSAADDVAEEARQGIHAEIAVAIVLWGALAWALWPLVKTWLTGR